MSIKDALDIIEQNHPDIVSRYQAGEAKLYGFFIGKAMRLLGEKTNVVALHHACMARFGGEA